MSRVYVASSWRNPHQAGVVSALRAARHDVYDFWNPPGRTGFSWRQAGADGAPMGAGPLRALLAEPVARAGFLSDYGAMAFADVFVLVLPAGRSAHLEMGWAAGARRRTIVYLPDDSPQEPDLMYLMCDRIVGDVPAVVQAVKDLTP